MDPETKAMLNESLVLARENNAMLKKLVSAEKWARIMRILYWSLILLSFFGSYYFLQPYLSSLLNLYSGGASGTTSMQDIMKGLDINKLQEELKNINQ